MYTRVKLKGVAHVTLTLTSPLSVVVGLGATSSNCRQDAVPCIAVCKLDLRKQLYTSCDTMLALHAAQLADCASSRTEAGGTGNICNLCEARERH